MEKTPPRQDPSPLPRVVVIQARLESQRRSGKGLALIGRVSLLSHVAQRALAITGVNHFVVATTDRPKDEELVSHLRADFGDEFHFIRGSSEDVQSRFLSVVQEWGACTMARITADDPFKDPSLYERGFDLVEQSGVDYTSIGSPPMPLGLDIEVFTSESLVRSRELFPTEENREHVTLAMVKQPEFSRRSLTVEGATPSQARLTVDYEEDIAFTSRVAHEIDALGGDFSYQTTLTALATVEEQDRRAKE